MKARRFVMVLAGILLAAASSAWAGGTDRVGTAGAQELRIPVGAASVAIGGSAVALGNGLENLFWNPASLASSDESEALVSYSTYLADSKVNYGAISARLGSQGMIALSAKVLNIGNITVTTENAPEGTGQILTPNFTVLGLSYGRRVTDRVLLGVTGSFVNERVADVKASGVAFDFGVQYDPGWRGFRFGFAMKNVGPNMTFDGAGLEQRLVLPGDDPSAAPHVVKLESTDFQLPSYLQIGAAYDIALGGGELPRHLSVYATFQGNNFSTDEYKLGAQLPVGDWLALRAGYVGQAPLKKADRQQDYLYSYTYGAGIKFKLGDRPVNFDWAGTHVGEFFNDNQQFSFRLAY